MVVDAYPAEASEQERREWVEGQRQIMKAAEEKPPPTLERIVKLLIGPNRSEPGSFCLQIACKLKELDGEFRAYYRKIPDDPSNRSALKSLPREAPAAHVLDVDDHRIRRRRRRVVTAGG